MTGRWISLVPSKMVQGFSSLRRGGADDAGGKAVDPVPQVALVLGEAERKTTRGVGVSYLRRQPPYS
ncbi:hypothetical protein PJ985_02135 [Streptomyces sp. ACA25]|uniref:hypothetical protein n=1 Tax=Streptomyces sp. ACA25 TaxID=3022596 RepID=UPI002307CBB0|nr:hypothetical protein [Streptomyces sp. ACA25]MDB1086373.1 hypothetical protein [Streptomyces sp. ACA25]